MAVTLQEITDKMYAILREDESTWGSYPLDFLQDLANSVQKRICSGKVKNPFTRDVVNKGRLPFLNKDQFYSNLSPTSLVTEAVVWGTTLDAETTNYPTSGTLYVDGNLITYTWTSATQFTGIPTSWDGSILFAHIAGTRIYTAFDLPADWMSGINVIYNAKYKLENKLYDDMFEDLNSIKGTNHFRLRNTTLFNEFIHLRPFYVFIDEKFMVPFNLNNDGDKVHMRYEKLPTKMSDTVDSVITDDDFAISTIPYVAVWELLYNRWEEARAAEILNFGLGQLAEMYDFYNNKSAEKPSKSQYKTWKHRWLNV